MVKRSILFCILPVALAASAASAAPVNIADPSFTHFANFTNDWPAGPLSRASNPTPASVYGDYGWHNSPSSDPGFPEYAGILLPEEYVVTGLKFQVHANPFRNFVLQGSTDTTTGLDGSWTDLFSSTVTVRSERAWQEWSFSNSVAGSAYRIKMLDDYAGGFAIYRWQLLGEEVAVPEPGALVLLGSGLAGLASFVRRGRTTGA